MNTRLCQHDPVPPRPAFHGWAGLARRAGGVGPTLFAGWADGVRRVSALLVLALLVLAGCAPHAGGDEIAYLRDGRLWTVNPDESGALVIGGGGVVGFAWSPDHHQLVFRYGTRTAAPSAEAAAPDAPSLLAVVGVDGGAAVTISPEGAGIARSDAWWDANGNRLLYREGLTLVPGQEPPTPVYILSQADQPAGIARRVLQDAADIPAMVPDGSQVAVIDPAGSVRVGPPGGSGRVVATSALTTLPGTDRPARPLWQPRHHALLYARAGASGGVSLVLDDLVGHQQTVGTVSALLDYAFAPDGSQLLVRTAADLEIWRWTAGAQQPAVFTWPEDDALALAWWSPDAHDVLVRDRAGLWVADTRARTVRQLLASAAPPAPPAQPPSWHPLTGSPWSADSTRIIFADPGTGQWLGHALPAARGATGGLYLASVSGSATPTLLNGGPDQWPSWSYLDPSASFLVAS